MNAKTCNYTCFVMPPKSLTERVNVSFIISKTRLAPIKTLTIPCLELQVAVVATRLKSKILEEIDFEVEETHLWSDSKIVLHHISNTHRRFSVYVAHRVAELSPTQTSKSGITSLVQ